jgi:hypothetical protein
MLLCGECYENVYRAYKLPIMMNSLYAFKCKRFRNTCHTVQFGMQLQSSFLNTLYIYVTVLGKGLCTSISQFSLRCLDEPLFVEDSPFSDSFPEAYSTILLARGNLQLNTGIPAVSSRLQYSYMYCSYNGYASSNKLRGVSPRANYVYTEGPTAACRRSYCQLLRLKGATWSAWWIPMSIFSDF